VRVGIDGVRDHDEVGNLAEQLHHALYGVWSGAGRCDKIIILNHGKVLIAGTIDSITGETKTKNLEEAFFYLVKKSDGEENYSF